MKHIFKYVKSVVYLFVMLILFQSCVVYNKSSVPEASGYDNWRIKINTTDGEKHILNWIEEKNGNVVSIKNTERVYINKSNILQIVIYNPDPHLMPLDSSSTYNGIVQIFTSEDYSKYENHEFIKFEKKDDSYKCYKMTGEDTLSVVIPLEQIEKIQVQDIPGSRMGNGVIVLGLISGLIIPIGFISEGGFNINFSN